VGGEGLQDDRHQGVNVLDRCSLGVKIDDGGGLEEGVGIAVWMWAAGVVVFERWLEELSRGGGGRAICLGNSLALASEGVERGLHARSGIGSRLGGSVSRGLQGKAMCGFLLSHGSSFLLMFLGDRRVCGGGGRGMLWGGRCGGWWRLRHAQGLGGGGRGMLRRGRCGGWWRLRHAQGLGGGG